MNANELMTENPEYVTVETTLEEVEEKLYELDIRHIPVVGGNGELVGILSDRDIRQYSARELTQVNAGEAMQGGVICASPDTSARDLIDLLLDHRVGAIPIVDPLDNQLVGIVSYIDLLRAAQDLFD